MHAPVYIEAQFVKAQIERLQLLYPEIAEDVEWLADVCEGETGLHELLSRIVREERDAVAMAEAVKAQQEALAARRARFDRKKEAARSLIEALMDAARQSKIKLPEATLSVVPGRKSCIVTDEALLPDAFVKIERTPKKSEITAALVDGKDVPGAALRNSQPYLTVRV